MRRLTLFLFLVTLIFISCDKTTEPEDWDPYGAYSGLLHEGNNGVNFENFIILSAGVSANGTITFMDGFETFEETIFISGDIEQEGNGYVLTGTFSLTIVDDNGSFVYDAQGNFTGELHYDEDMPFPEGTGSGVTNDGLRTISWNIYKSS